jgi:hypothetical protein
MGNHQKTVLPSTVKRVLAALEQTGGRQAEAARLLGLSVRRVQQILKAMRANGIEVPPSPQGMLHHYRPDQARIHGTSTLIDADGNTRLQWIKEQAGKPTLEEVTAAMRTALGDLPSRPSIPAPNKGSRDLLCVYPMGDPHIGMYAWAEETGSDFDLDIAERNLVAAVRHLVNVCPPAEQALIVNVGDFFHADNKENKTMRSGAVLDVDTRWAKVLRVGLRAMRACIDAALERHKSVRVINEIGNHDEHSSQMLTIALSMYYDHNKRVTFDESPAKFHYYRFGKNLIGVTHGDSTKFEALGPIMAHDRAADWGETLHRYWYTGHVHHRRVLELVGCTAESFRTLAARDAWHAGSGYRSGRDMSSIVLDREHGEIERHRVDITVLDKLFS